jgi:hypothetical protein
MWQEGGDPVQAGEVLRVPSLLRPPLRKPARGQEGPGLEAGAEDQAAPGREREHAGAVSREPKGMHLDTYMRLLWKYDEAHREHLAGMQEWLDKQKQQVS